MLIRNKCCRSSGWSLLAHTETNGYMHASIPRQQHVAKYSKVVSHTVVYVRYC